MLYLKILYNIINVVLLLSLQDFEVTGKTISKSENRISISENSISKSENTITKSQNEKIFQEFFEDQVLSLVARLLYNFKTPSIYKLRLKKT